MSESPFRPEIEATDTRTDTNAEFTGQRTFGTFSRLNLPARELPRTTVALLRCTLRDEIVAILTDDGGYDVDGGPGWLWRGWRHVSKRRW